MKKNTKKLKAGNSHQEKREIDDSLNKLDEHKEETPEIFKISKKGKPVKRKDFIKSAGQITGLAALGSLFDGCEESEYDITSENNTCTCHVVCTCNKESLDEDEEQYEKGSNYVRTEVNGTCTCDTVCTCNTVCTCDSVCSCNSESSGSSCGSYWYPC